MSRRAKIAMFIVLGVVAAGLIYLRALGRRIFVETPLRVEQEARTKLSQVALQSQTGSTQTVMLYFPAYEQGMLVGEARQIGWASDDVDRVREVLLALIEGSHEGRARVVSPSASIRAVFLTTDGTAYVDLSSDAVSDFAPGIASETLAVYSIVDSLAANIPAVRRVKITVQGQEVDTLDGHADLTGTFVPDPARIAKAN
ncbi:MAG TPA: GerMN domain-containing protein [Terriglobia bacterium]|nr:GerMN domain-containing protein [Terriglobia bacterium]